MSRRADILVQCDVCLTESYWVKDRKSGSLIYQRTDWFDGHIDRFEWKCIGKDLDVCPGCLAIIGRAKHLGLT